MTRWWPGRRAALTAAGVGVGLAGRAALRRLRADDLTGQVALITGGSRGLGFLLAREFGQAGCRVALCARDEDELRRARAELADAGVEALGVPCDVGDLPQVEAMMERVTERLGGVDILVANAGTIEVGPIATMTTADFQRAMDIMFWGVLHPILAVLPGMRERGRGRIVTITSIGGKVSVPHLVPYSSAKFAAVGLSEGLRAELARENIKVVTIVPGLMRTGSIFNAYFKGQQEQEFSLFSLAGSLPFLSMDAERAARQIVLATRLGEAERTLSIPATLMARFHGIFPGPTANLLGLINRALPGPGGAGAVSARGVRVDQRIESAALDALTAMSRSAADRFNEQPGPSSIPAIRRPPDDARPEQHNEAGKDEPSG